MPSTDRDYLLTQQYHDATNLDTRVQLHQRFRTNPRSWYHWIFDQFVFPAKARILELGCGSGALWQANCPRLVSGWEIMLSDFSPGMLADAQQNLQACSHPFSFERIDAQAIPFAEDQFDAVVANNMLYHVPDRARALAEIQRVLRPSGRLYAATNGPTHMREVRALIERFDPSADTGALTSFTLEQGRADLSFWFSSVNLHRYDNMLIVTEAEPLIDYIMSTRRLRSSQRTMFCNFIRGELAASGQITITIDAGMLEATREA